MRRERSSNVGVVACHVSVSAATRINSRSFRWCSTTGEISVREVKLIDYSSNRTCVSRQNMDPSKCSRPKRHSCLHVSHQRHHTEMRTFLMRRGVVTQGWVREVSVHSGECAVGSNRTSQRSPGLVLEQCTTYRDILPLATATPSGEKAAGPAELALAFRWAALRTPVLTLARSAANGVCAGMWCASTGPARSPRLVSQRRWVMLGADVHHARRIEHLTVGMRSPCKRHRPA